MKTMVRVKIFGVMRLKSGVSSFETEAGSINELLNCIPGIERKEAKNLVVIVNDRPAGRYCKLKDGDEVVLLSPAGGG